MSLKVQVRVACPHCGQPVTVFPTFEESYKAVNLVVTHDTEVGGCGVEFAISFRLALDVHCSQGRIHWKEGVIV